MNITSARVIQTFDLGWKMPMIGRSPKTPYGKRAPCVPL
jgi:hypothetical protein